MSNRKKIVIAGIGSRNTPPDILDEMREIGRYIKHRHGYIRSGHALGADYAFEEGAEENTVVYLPWKNFNPELQLLTESVVDFSALIKSGSDVAKAAFSSVDRLHPRAETLTFSQRKILARNYLQIHGINGTPVDLVVCWAQPHLADLNRLSGGTGFTTAIAKEAKVPVFNLYEDALDYVLGEIDGVIEDLNRPG